MRFSQAVLRSKLDLPVRRVLGFGCLLLGLMAQAWAGPKVVVISLDGCKPAIVQQLLSSGALSPNQGIGLLFTRGAFATGSETASPSLTAVNHIALATGSTGAHNDIPSNTFHLVASPFTSNVSGFGAPIGGYNVVGPSESANPTAEPLWIALRNAGKTVITATWPGGDGIDVQVPGIPGPIVQSHTKRTVDYTVPFGAFAGQGGKGFALTATNFSPAPQAIVDALTAAGKTSFSPVQLTTLETISVSGISFTIDVATLDTTDDSAVNYDTLVFFDTTNGIKPGPFSLPSTGPAYVRFSDGSSQPFYFEGTSSKAGAGFFVSALAPDLSTVHIARYSADAIPTNPFVAANVNDINNNVGFWADQHDFRFPERLNPGLTSFSDLELEAIDHDLNVHFVDYQTRVALRAMSQLPNADLEMIYIEEPDGFEHQYLLTDPRQATNPLDPTSILGGQDPAKIARYQQNIALAYQQADEAVQRIIDASGGLDLNGIPVADIFLVSDHGFAPFHTAVNLNNLFAANGLDSSQVRAVTSGPAANIYISLLGREQNGKVSRGDYLKLRKKVQTILKSFMDTNSNYTNGAASIPVFEKVIVRPTPGGVNDPNFGLDTSEFVGQDSGDIYALMSLGYNFDGTQSPVVQRMGDAPSSAPVLSVPNFYGAHGYNPKQPDMNAFFAAAGPDIKPGLIHRGVHNIDLAPTVEKLLGVTPAATVQGKALLTILKK